ncbi:GINS complex subunit [Myotisia sp. PD_48]|nr:GINS complex subunit [Myotisia sp. PD_48]
MDEIDDILASIDRDDSLSSPQATALDHQLLTRFWVAERAAPELLPWPGTLVERMMKRLAKQITTIEDLSIAASDPASNPNSNPTTSTLSLSILQSDLSRTQFLLRSLLRQRLSKLTKYSIYYLRLSTNIDDSSQTQSQPQGTQATRIDINHNDRNTQLMSEQELHFLRSHQSILTTHYNGSFLSEFPPNLRRLDDNVGGTNMVVTPENKEVVFVRCLADQVHIVIPASAGERQSDDIFNDRMPGMQQYGSTMSKGEIWVVRWEGIRDAWKEGEVELL